MVTDTYNSINNCVYLKEKTYGDPQGYSFALGTCATTEAIVWNVIFADYVEEIDLLSYVTN